MILDDMILRSGGWLGAVDSTGIVISSRIRLARNVAGAAFPGWAGEEERVRLAAQLRAALTEVPALRATTYLDMGDLNEVDRLFLTERHLISAELAEKGRGSGVLFSDDEQVAVMVNEEDHLRLQAMRPGMDLPGIWQQLDGIDSALEDQVSYAFSPTLGYLTACPSNVGTGLRASVMLHLPGLRFMNEVEPVAKGLQRIGLAVRGLLGEGTEASGNMYQVSNQITLGDSEENTIRRLIEIVEEVVQHEENARLRLAEQQAAYLKDRVGRAYGILSYASLLTSEECMDLLSTLRLGQIFGLVRGLSVSAINELFVRTQPGHLQRIERRILSPEQRDQMRAGIARAVVRAAELV